MAEAVITTPYRKKAIPLRVRREVALKYGCVPGGTLKVPCHRCGTRGWIHWHCLHDGSPSGWVTFSHELDHVFPEVHGGLATVDNLALACRRCNRRKGAKV